MHAFAFATLTLSPAIDHTITSDRWPTPDAVLVGSQTDVTAGGKGLNVGQWLARRGHSVLATGLMGAAEEQLFCEFMRASGMTDAFHRVPARNRHNFVVTTPKGQLKVNEPTFPELTEGSITWSGFFDELVRADVCILSGSVPRAVTDQDMGDLIACLQKHGSRVVLDTSGEALVRGVAAHPDLIKPNRAECSALLDCELRRPDQLRTALRRLLERVPMALISVDADGCWFGRRAEPDVCYHVEAPVMDPVKDTTAAGDTFLAEFCHQYFGVSRKANPETELGTEAVCAALRFASAAGASACEMPGAQSPNLNRVTALAQGICVTKHPMTSIV